MRKTWLAMAISANLGMLGAPLALSACGKEAPPAPDTTQAAADVAVDTAPAPKPSKLPEATELFGRPLAKDGIAGAIALADALAEEGSPEAKLASARTRLLAVAHAASAQADLGEGGAEKQLRLALSALEGGGEGTPAVTVAVNALLGLLAGQRELLPEAGALAPLLADDKTPEAIAVRIAVAHTYASMSAASAEGGFGAFMAGFGPLVCKTCGEGATAEALATALACEPPSAPYCASLTAAAGATPVAKLGSNALTIASLALADAATKATGPHAPTLAALGEKLTPVQLPLPVALPEGVSLGGEGLGAKRGPATVVAIGVDALRIGLRPVIDRGGANTVKAELALEAATPLLFAEMDKVEADKETGAIAGVTDRITALADSVGADGAPARLAETVLLAIDPAAPVAAVTKIADGLAAAQAKAPRGLFLLRPGMKGEVLPVHLRAIAPELEAKLSPAWDKSIIVVVGAEAIDVWAPDGAKEGAAPLGPEAQDKLPTSVEQGWRGERLARLRLPLPPAQADAGRLGPAEQQALGAAIKVFFQEAKAGRVMHVVAGEGATTAEVLEVGRHLSEGLDKADELSKVDEIWAESRCLEAGCATGVPVLFSKAAVPSARGLTDKPEKGKKPAKEEPAGPAPSAEFCNQADIKSQMAKKAGAFRFCYERELQLEKDLEGRVVMSYVIGLDGGVKNVRASSNELGSAKVADCVKKEIGKIKFKVPDGGECVVQWPFQFRKN